MTMGRQGPRTGDRGISRMLNRIANHAMKLLLRSPLHGPASGKFMLITVTGRRSARRYTTPVNYVRDGETLTVFSREERTWWRNLKGGASVVLRLQGRDLPALAEVPPASREELARAFQDFYQRLAGRRLSLEEATRRSEGRVIVRVRLDARDA